MRLSCTSASFPALSFEQAAMVIGQLDLECVDADCYTGGQIAAESVLADPGAAADRILRAVDRAGIVVSQLFFTFGTDFFDRAANSPDKAVRGANVRLVQAMARCAVLCGARGLTTLPGVIWPDLGPERSLDLAASALGNLVAVAAEAGLPLQVEPHLDSVIATPERARSLVDRVPNLRLTVDYAHFLVQGYAAGDVHGLLSCAGHVHARHAAVGHLQTPARRSELDFADICRRLLQAGYAGDVSLEFVPFREWGGVEEVDVISQTIQLRDVLRAASL